MTIRQLDKAANPINNRHWKCLNCQTPAEAWARALCTSDLKRHFPRLPLTSVRELFRLLIAKGAELADLHLMQSPMLNNLVTQYPIVGPNQVETVRYDEDKQRPHINKSQYIEGVSPGVWNFHIGGYQVCQKWLKDRKERILSYDELTHYQKVVVALKETIRLMEGIDQLIPDWPVEVE